MYFRVDEVSGFVVYTCYRNAVVPLIDEIHKQKQFYHRFDYIKKTQITFINISSYTFFLNISLNKYASLFFNLFNIINMI